MKTLDQLLIGFRLHASAVESEELLTPMVRECIQAYADGVNDYVAGIGYGLGATGNLFPPEFYVFGIEWEPYTVVDALAIMRLLAVYTSLSWPFDLVREQIRHYPELTDLTDEIMPFRSDLVYNNRSIIDDDELKYFDQYSE